MRKDPRVEPESNPPDPKAESGRNERAAEIVGTTQVQATLRESLTDPSEAMPGSRTVTSVDPRLEAIEPLLDRGDWAGIAQKLGPTDAAGKLPPTLGLVYALAVHEKTDDPQASAMAIRCAAGLFGVAPESGTARVLARRLLRKNPTWRHKPAPATRYSVLFILAALAIGSGIGWVLSSGWMHLPPIRFCAG